MAGGHSFANSQDLIDEAYTPSLWKMQHATLLYLVRAVLGPLALDTLLHLEPSAYRRLAHPPRK